MPLSLTGPPPTSESPQEEAAVFWRSRQWWGRVTHASASSWVGHALLVLSTIVAARGLGPHDYGSFVLVLSVCSLLALFLDFTLEEALVYYGVQDKTLRGGTNLRRLFTMAARIDVALGVIVFGLLVLGAPAISSVATSGAVEASLVRIGALTVLAATVDGTTGAALLVAGRPELRARGMLIGSAVRLVMIAVAVRHGTSAALGAAAAATLLGAVVQSALAWRVAWRSWPANPDPRGNEVGLRSLLFFGAQSSLTSSLAAATVSVVPVVLGRTLGPTAVANFSVASGPLAAAGILTAPIRTAVLPEQAALWARGRRAELRRSLLVLGGTVMAFTVPLIGVAWLGLPRLLPFVYGHQFESAVPVSRILLFALLGLIPTSWMKLIAVASGRPSLRTVVGTIDLVVTVAVVGVLSATYGLSGAAWGFVGSCVVVALAWLVTAVRTLPDQTDVRVRS